MVGWTGQTVEARLLRLEENDGDVRKELVEIREQLAQSQRILISILVAIIIGIIVGVIVSQVGPPG